MQVLLLNRARDTARLAFQQRQLAALGLSFRRIEAVTPESLTLARDDPYWTGWERPLSDVEKSILATHCHAWAEVAALGAPALILEDDAWLSVRAPDFLAAVARMDGIDHVTLETRGRKKLIAAAPDPRLPLRRLYQDRTGAAAYVLFPRGAQKLLARSARAPGLADAIICAAYELASFQADPALAIQLDQAGRYGRNPPLGEGSTHAPVTRAGAGGTRQLGYRLSRIMAQLRMGLRRIKCYGRAVRREVELAPDLWAG
ncbi:MAG: glycosyltransferase family 25 protein [Alphaproteobacteria bacterium]|nr:glycosyltransferase family 25 protein [Alphaproteobacteria bacterium]